MPITWTEDLATGIPEIDSQHKELFVRINSLLEACNQGKGRKEIEGTITFLAEYTDRHFNAEQQWMVKKRYPEYEKHKAQHDVFIGNLRDLEQKLTQEGPGLQLVILTNQLVTDWLRAHIRTFDQAFGVYLRTGSGEQA